MNSSEAVEMLMVLVPWLLQRQGATVTEAAEAVGADEDDVRTHLESLAYCGGPGLRYDKMFEISFSGDRVVIERAPGMTATRPPSAAEAIQLVVALGSVQQVLGERLPALATALDKITRAAGLDSNVLDVTLDTDEWLARLAAAVDSGHVVRIGHRARDADTATTRQLDPWQLEHTLQGWYLHGHDHDRDAHRVFRVDRISHVEVTDDRVTTEAPDDLPSPRWTPTGDVTAVTLRLRESARWIGDHVATTSDRDTAGVREVTFDTDSLEWTANLVASGLPHVEVVDPPELGAVVARRAVHARDLHASLRRAATGPGQGT